MNFPENHDSIPSLGSVIPPQLVEETKIALSKLYNALGDDICGYVSRRLRMSTSELADALAIEQVESVALAMYNIETRSQSLIIGDQTGIGKGRQAAAMIRYGLLPGYLPVFFTDRYTLFSDMYRDCKALGIKDARPLIVNAGVSIVDFDIVLDGEDAETPDEIWSPVDEEENTEQLDVKVMQLYKKQYQVIYKSPKKRILQAIFENGDIPSETYDYLMVTYSQLKDSKRDATRLDFLQSLCEKHRVLFIFDEAHRSSSVSAGKLSVITQGINRILVETSNTQCVFLSATFAKRPESLITFMRRTALGALATDHTLETALHSGGIPMQEFVSSKLAAEGQMIRREHASVGIPSSIYTYLDNDKVLHGELFDKVMFFFREAVKLSAMVNDFVNVCQMNELLLDYKCYPTRAQLFYINKVLLLSLKAYKVAQVAIEEVKNGRSVVIGMSDTLECILKDLTVNEDGSVIGDISTLLKRLLEKTVRSTNQQSDCHTAVYDLLKGNQIDTIALSGMADEIRDYHKYIIQSMNEEVFHLPMSPIDVIRQLITKEHFVTPDGLYINIRFEECTGRAHQLEYLSPEGDDDYVNARVVSRKKRHSNHIYNDFQNNKLDVILINACGAIGASAHAISTMEVPEEQVRQRKMLIVQNDLDVNIDLQKRGRINRTGQREDLPPLYEYIITAIPSEKRLNMMLRAKLRSLSANTAAWQDQDKDLADFIDINNKYGNEVATDYIEDHPELAQILGLKNSVTASVLLARIAMLSVTAQQDIVDDLMTAYTTLEAELRRINQWDLEREYRDFEAEFVQEELFTTAKAESKLGGCSYLTTYKCKQKTFPYSFDTLSEYCRMAQERFGKPYLENPELQKQVQNYYKEHKRKIKIRFNERLKLLYENSKRILLNYLHDLSLVENLLNRACTPADEWSETYFYDIDGHERSKQIQRKLISFSNEYNHLLDREKKQLKKYAMEKKRLIEILSQAVIGNGYNNISEQIARDECPDRVIAVLIDIRFGKEEKDKFLPSRVELVFALTAVYTEIRINLVHNNKWSNYERLIEILRASSWKLDSKEWNQEIAANNNKIVERKIITGNILGAYVHPAISELKPRFIKFSLKGKKETQSGLLLPLDESKIRQVIKDVSIPLNEGIKFATNANTSYTIAGLGVNFSLLPYRVSDSLFTFVISVFDMHSRKFESDNRFDSIRKHFHGSTITSMFNNDESGSKRRKALKHYQTKQLVFESEGFQEIVQSLSHLDAVIIVPRDQITYGEVKEFSSRAEKDNTEPWTVLDWKSSDDVPLPPAREHILLRISAPIIKKEQKGKPVLKHSSWYMLVKETIALEGLPMGTYSTLSALRRYYMQWKVLYESLLANRHTPDSLISLSEARHIWNEMRCVIENRQKALFVRYEQNMKNIFQRILDSEYLEADGVFQERFNNEMLFLSPDKSTAQAFLDEMPCSSKLDAIRKCIIDYINGKTDIIYSPYKW